MKKKIVKIIVSAAITIVLISIIILVSKGIRSYQEYCRNIVLLRESAIYVAQEYLEENYEEEMIYVRHTCMYDKMIWNIYFSPKSDPEQIFSVLIYESHDTDLPIRERFKVQNS